MQESYYCQLPEDLLTRYLILWLLSLSLLGANAQQNISSTARVDDLPTDTARIDLKQFAASLVANARTDSQRAEQLLHWLSRNFKWLSTDYQKRTVKEIIVRKGGNCFELATVYMSLIKTLGLKYRQVAEINIQPRSERRQGSAETLVTTRGYAYSVFGEQHNDHRWVEIYDETSNAWIPADPSVGVIGLEPWLKSRVWFGDRWAIDTSITNDMIVPFAIFVTGGGNKIVEDRTNYYVMKSFDKLYNGELSTLPSWNTWKSCVAGISERCKGAFEGKVNLHEYRGDIAHIASTYERLRLEYEKKSR